MKKKEEEKLSERHLHKREVNISFASCGKPLRTAKRKLAFSWIKVFLERELGFKQMPFSKHTYKKKEEILSLWHSC
jgi:hypothetical protein